MYFRYLINNVFYYYTLDNLEKGISNPAITNKYYTIRNQYIGTNDKNGKPIYEDDIVKVNIGSYHRTLIPGKKHTYDMIFVDKFINTIVEYDAEKAKFNVELNDDEDIIWCLVEVVGNIHENKEINI